MSGPVAVKLAAARSDLLRLACLDQGAIYLAWAIMTLPGKLHPLKRKSLLAMTYSPRGLPPKYHRR